MIIGYIDEIFILLNNVIGLYIDKIMVWLFQFARKKINILIHRNLK